MNSINFVALDSEKQFSNDINHKPTLDTREHRFMFLWIIKI